VIASPSRSPDRDAEETAVQESVSSVDPEADPRAGDPPIEEVFQKHVSLVDSEADPRAATRSVNPEAGLRTEDWLANDDVLLSSKALLATLYLYLPIRAEELFQAASARGALDKKHRQLAQSGSLWLTGNVDGMTDDCLVNLPVLFQVI
jgi:hypothetical protein